MSLTNEYTLKIAIAGKTNINKKQYYAKNSITFEFRIVTTRKPSNENATNVYPTWEELLTEMNTDIKAYQKTNLTKEKKLAVTALVSIGIGFAFVPIVPEILVGIGSIVSNMESTDVILNYLDEVLKVILPKISK